MSPARRRFLRLLATVAALHVGAIALYYVLDIPQATLLRQRSFAWVWMAVTVVVIVIALHRIKRARRH